MGGMVAVIGSANVDWFWTVLLLILLAIPSAIVLALFVLYLYLCRNYLGVVVRIFKEKPLFVIPRGQPVAWGEEVRLATSNGLSLQGCYFRRRTAARRGVILFGLEYGSNRWSSLPYCEHLLEAGYDVFTFEPRNQGDSDALPGYEPMQWVTQYEVEDFQAASRYLQSRPDADPRGVGLFGISRGGSAGLLAAAKDSYLRCFVTDGIFASYTVMVPYMRKWISIYSDRIWLQVLLPRWYYGLVGRAGIRMVERERGLKFPYLESAMARLAPRPLLMIHGEGDTYIKPEMSRSLFARARRPKTFWLVPGAKHNQALTLAKDEYRRTVLEFFDRHLGAPQEPAVQPVAEPAAAPSLLPANA